MTAISNTPLSASADGINDNTPHVLLSPSTGQKLKITSILITNKSDSQDTNVFLNIGSKQIAAIYAGTSNGGGLIQTPLETAFQNDVDDDLTITCETAGASINVTVSGCSAV